MNFDMENFSRRLSDLLDENNMTQTQLAKEVGTSNVTICRYITGERTPRIDVLTKIANVFNVSLDYLLGLTNESDEKEKHQNTLNYNIEKTIRQIYNIDDKTKLSMKQINLVKKLLEANEDFILFKID